MVRKGRVDMSYLLGQSSTIYASDCSRGRGPVTVFRVTGVVRVVDLLPIPTDDYLDIGTVLRANLSDLRPRIDVVVGPDDAGKSALLRTLAADHHAASHRLQFLDLSITSWRNLNMEEISKVEALLIDHIDRINDPDHFSVAFDMLDRLIPSIFAVGSLVLVLSLGQDWRSTFWSIYRINPETLLQRSIPTITVKLHYLRPYDDAELTVLCRNLGLDPQSLLIHLCERQAF